MSRKISLRVRVVALFLLVLGMSVVNWMDCPSAQAQTSAIVSLSLSPDTFLENAGPAAALGTATLSQLQDTDLVITLTNSDTSELQIPATVTIPAGQMAANFNVDAVDDTDVDGTQYVYVNGTAANATVIGLTVPVKDDESALTFTVAPDTVNESSGENAAFGTVSRTAANADAELALSVFSDNTDLVTVPATLTMPAGATSVTFPIGVNNNDESTGNLDVTITVIRTNSTDSAVSAHLTVIDDESLLTLELGRTTLSETAGLRATTAKISRSEAATAGDLPVNLDSSDTSEIVVPPYVAIPDGATSVEVPVGVIDDLEADGPQVVRLTVAAQGFSSGSEEITVTDNETPTLRLEIYGTAVNEGTGSRALVGVIHRNTPVRESISVALRSSDTSEITVPATVVIPRGAESVTFPINAPQDTIVDPVQNVTISATRAGFRSSSASLQVIDDEGPSFRLRFEAAPGNAVEEDAQPVKVTVTRFNTSLASPQTVAISSNNRTFVDPPTTPVVIPANLASTTFFVAIGDNQIPEDTQWATLTASAGGFRNGVATLVVNDNKDSAVLTFKVDAPLAIDPSASPTTPPALIPTISETAGPTATYATVSRNTATTSDVIVKLSSLLPGALQVPEVIVIPFGKSSVTFPLSAVDDLQPCPDPEFATLLAQVSGFVDGRINVRVVDNDGACIPIRVVSVSVDNAAPVVESDGSHAGTVTVTRIDQETNLYGLRVALTSDPQRLTVPSPILIPRGKQSVQVPMTAIDNIEVEGCRTVTIAPVAEAFVDPNTGRDIKPEDVGYKTSFLSISENVGILDNESPLASLSVRPSSFRESGSSGVATGTVTRAGSDLSKIITVKLASTNPKEATVPPLVEIPAGQRSASFAVTGVQDGKVDGTQTAQIVAEVECHTVKQTADVSVQNVDVPTLTLKVVPTLMESAGVDAGIGYVKRNTPPTAALKVKLSSSEAGALILPAEVTIPAGADAVSFKVGVNNDLQVLGTRRVTITASQAGYLNGTMQVVIREDDVPALSLTLTPSRVSEAAGAQAAQGRVERNTTSRAPLTVGLTSNSGAATVPLRVIIPAGASSATFPIDVFDDGRKTAPRTAIISATARGFKTGPAALTVTDSNKLQGAAAAGDLSNATARVTDGTVQLQFNTALQADSAGDAGRYEVRVNDRAAEVEAVSYRATGNTVTLSLRLDALHAGDRVTVHWNGLLDTQGRSLSGSTTELRAR